MDVDLVVFDKDGTLIDVHHYWGGMVRLRAKELSRCYVESQKQEEAIENIMSSMGIDLATGKIRPTGPVGLKSREFVINEALQAVKRYFHAITFEQVSLVFQEVDVYSQAHLSQLVKPLPGVKELLVRLKQKKIKTAIATTDLTSRAKLAMNSVGLGHYFDEVVGADLVDNAKPSPDLVNYLCDKMSVGKNKTVVIGDSIVDLKMAEAAAVGFIGIKTGLYSPEFLARSTVLLDDLSSAKEALS